MSDPDHEDAPRRTSRPPRPPGDGRVDDRLGGITNRLDELCRSLTGELSGMGVAISLMSVHGSAAVAAASDEFSRAAGELQFAVGEGPSHDAYAGRRPVLVPDLRGAAGGRWPGFTSMALQAGIQAVFAIPLQQGAAGFGVLDVFGARPASLTRRQQDRLVSHGDIAAEILLDGDVVTAIGDPDAGLSAALDARAEIHQAQGMTMVDLAVGPEEALTRMRARAFAHETSLADLARMIIAGYDLSDEDDQ